MCHVPLPIWWFVGYLFLSKQSETLNTLDMHISLQSFVGSITFYREINKSLNLLSWKRYKCCHSAASWLQPVKNTGKQHQVQYKRTGIYHFSSSLDSLFSAVTSWGINTYPHNSQCFPDFLLKFPFTWDQPGPPLLTLNAFTVRGPRAPSLTQSSTNVWAKSHSLAPSTPQPRGWGKMFTWDFWCLKSKVMTCNSKPPAREWWWVLVFMMSGKILLYIAADLSGKAGKFL